MWNRSPLRVGEDPDPTGLEETGAGVGELQVPVIGSAWLGCLGSQTHLDVVAVDTALEDVGAGLLVVPDIRLGQGGLHPILAVSDPQAPARRVLREPEQTVRIGLGAIDARRCVPEDQRGPTPGLPVVVERQALVAVVDSHLGVEGVQVDDAARIGRERPTLVLHRGRARVVDVQLPLVRPRLTVLVERLRSKE
jgi:hypothetical protein